MMNVFGAFDLSPTASQRPPGDIVLRKSER